MFSLTTANWIHSKLNAGVLWLGMRTSQLKKGGDYELGNNRNPPFIFAGGETLIVISFELHFLWLGELQFEHCPNYSWDSSFFEEQNGSNCRVLYQMHSSTCLPRSHKEGDECAAVQEQQDSLTKRGAWNICLTVDTICTTPPSWMLRLMFPMAIQTQIVSTSTKSLLSIALLRHSSPILVPKYRKAI